MAFNAKNLTYDKSEPAFLQRLKAGYAAQDGRNNIQHARPGKSRLKMGDGDDDDSPVILDESGNVVEKGVYEGMMKGESIETKEKNANDGGVSNNGRDQPGSKGSPEAQNESEREKQTEAAIGAVRKRKAVKVVGADDEDGLKGSEKLAQELDMNRDVKDKKMNKNGIDKPKKKTKKIKLSFDEPE